MLWRSGTTEAVGRFVARVDDSRHPTKMGALAMNPLRPVIAVKRQLVWLLWLALLLPVAQATASWHALSHIEPGTTNGADDPRTLRLTHCDLCPSAAAVSGGVLPNEPPSLPPHPVARHDVPQAASSGVRLAFSAPAYLGRAPPQASC